MQIKNLPPQFLSKLDSIMLVAVCRAQNLDQKGADLPNVLDIIVQDLKQIEDFGIDLGNNLVIHGALINTAHDMRQNTIRLQSLGI